MKRLILNFLTIAIILPVAFVGCTKRQINMTTEKIEVRIGMGGSGFATIDWGDDTLKETKPFDDDGWLVFDYEYQNDTLHTITITGENITELICYGNQLKTLNVIGFTELEWLHCAANELLSLNVNGLTGLKKLHCYGNQLTSLNVSKLTKLEYLGCGDNNMTAAAFDALFTSLPTVISGTIGISSNNVEYGDYGTSGSNTSIATEKGWTLYIENLNFW